MFNAAFVMRYATITILTLRMFTKDSFTLLGSVFRCQAQRLSHAAQYREPKSASSSLASSGVV